MNGIASLLDKSAASRVEFLWKELETRCGLVGVKTTPFPHISWQVTGTYDFPALERALNSLASQASPFTIHSTGLGLFTGENPILFISILKDENLMRFHSLLWEETINTAIQPSLYYSPANWVPHITLAYNDLDQHKLGCAIQYLVIQNFDWEIRIDKLIFISKNENEVTDMVEYNFGGPAKNS